MVTITHTGDVWTTQLYGIVGTITLTGDLQTPHFYIIVDITTFTGDEQCIIWETRINAGDVQLLHTCILEGTKTCVMDTPYAPITFPPVSPIHVTSHSVFWPAPNMLLVSRWQHLSICPVRECGGHREGFSLSGPPLMSQNNKMLWRTQYVHTFNVYTLW